MQLRDYQIDIIHKTIQSNQSTLIQLPTGSGKTIIAKKIAKRLTEEFGKQVLFVAPKIVLMDQTVQVFSELNPIVVHGNEIQSNQSQVLISTLQTASRRTDTLSPDVIIIDEIHFGFEGKMIEALIKERPNCRVIGLSATPYDKKGNLLKGFRLILDQYDLEYMVKQAYLVPIKTYVLTKIANLQDVPTMAGDYNLKILGNVVSNPQTILEVVQTSSPYISEHNKAIVFAVDIGHSELLAEAYRNEGYDAVALHSKVSKETINRYIEDFKNGKIKVLVSVSMLTTGFDVPDTDLAIIARPTKSQNLYKQMVGRVLRIVTGKKEATLLDCGNVVENLGMPLDPIKETSSLQRESKEQHCPECDSTKFYLKTVGDEKFWQCKKCWYRKDVKTGSYKCKMCNTMYTHNAQFEQKGKKLYLVCPQCPYPTLISEYSGNERFIESKSVKQNSSSKYSTYLSYEEAQKYIQNLKFKSIQDWKNFKNDVENGKASLPKNIPTEPHIVYQNNGWKDTKSWLGINDILVVKDVDITKYLPFEEARRFVMKLNLMSLNEWGEYRRGLMKHLSNKPENIPDKPQSVYKNRGWIGFENWLGVDIKRDKVKQTIIQAIGNENVDIITNTINNTQNVFLEEIMCQLVERLPENIFGPVANKLTKANQVVLINQCVIHNRYAAFIKIAELEYKLTEPKEKSALCRYQLQSYIYNDGKEYLSRYITENAILKNIELIALNKDQNILMYYIENVSSGINNIKVLKKCISLDLTDIVGRIIDSIESPDELYYAFMYEDEDGFDLLNDVLSLYPERWKTFQISIPSVSYDFDEDIDGSQLDYALWELSDEVDKLFELVNLLDKYDIKPILEESEDSQLNLTDIIKLDHKEMFALLWKIGLDDNYKLFDTHLTTFVLWKSPPQIMKFLIDESILLPNEFNFYLSIMYGVKNKKDLLSPFQLFGPSYNLNQSVDDNGDSLLHIACEANEPSIVELLLGGNANPTIVNKYGKTPFDLAESLKHDEIVILLKQSLLDMQNNIQL